MEGVLEWNHCREDAKHKFAEFSSPECVKKRKDDIDHVMLKCAEKGIMVIIADEGEEVMC